MTGSILSLQTCLGHREPMRPLDQAELLDGGIVGDTHFAPGSARQLLLIEAETLSELGLMAGQLKENLTVAGLPLMGLSEGSRLAVGLAELEITKPCEPCSRVEEIRPGLQHRMEGRRGMLARVIRPGTVRPGDVVRVLEPRLAP